MDRATGNPGGHCALHQANRSGSEACNSPWPNGTFQLCYRLDRGVCSPPRLAPPASLSAGGVLAFGPASESLGPVIVAEASDTGTGVGTTELFSEAEIACKESTNRFPTSK